VGKGWTGTPAVTSPAGTAIAGLGAPVQTDGGAYIDYTFTLPSGFTLTRPASGDSPVIRVRLNSAPADNGYPLMYQVEVYGEARGQNGASTGDYYSRDRGGSRIIGVDLTHDILSTSEPDSSEDLPATASVLIGEEITYRIGARFFGAQSEITNLI